MINHQQTRQDWHVNSVVKVGWLTLRIVSIVLTPRDGRPDVYILESIDGAKRYRFTPHYGIERINEEHQP
jgi:hypothetical protein